MMRMLFACEMVLIWCSVLSATCSVARADLITFWQDGDFNDPLIDEQTSGSITRLGLTATFTANVGVLNATNENFGIKVTGSGDETDLLDSGSGVDEFITISFDQPVEFTQLTLRLFSGVETAKLTVGLNPTLTIDPTSAAVDVYDFTSASFSMGNLIAPGQSLIIGSGAGNGFSLEGFQVNTVPEPSCVSVVLSALTGLLFRRKRMANCSVKTINVGRSY